VKKTNYIFASYEVKATSKSITITFTNILLIKYNGRKKQCLGLRKHLGCELNTFNTFT